MASGAWQHGVFCAHLRLVETPHMILLELDPDAGTVRMDWRLVPLSGVDPLALAAAFRSERVSTSSTSGNLVIPADAGISKLMRGLDKLDQRRAGPTDRSLTLPRR